MTPAPTAARPSSGALRWCAPEASPHWGLPPLLCLAPLKSACSVYISQPWCMQCHDVIQDSPDACLLLQSTGTSDDTFRRGLTVLSRQCKPLRTHSYSRNLFLHAHSSFRLHLSRAPCPLQQPARLTGIPMPAGPPAIPPQAQHVFSFARPASKHSHQYLRPAGRSQPSPVLRGA